MRHARAEVLVELGGHVGRAAERARVLMHELEAQGERMLRRGGVGVGVSLEEDEEALGFPKRHLGSHLGISMRVCVRCRLAPR